MIIIKSKREIELMREPCKVTAEIFRELEEFIVPGVTTKDIDQFVETRYTKHKMAPTFKGYGGFPAAACVSVNEEIIHGIPSDKRVLKEGDIVTCDVCCSLDGMHADAARTFAVGKISEEAAQLVRVTEECFWKGFEKATTDNRIGDVSSAVQTHAESFGYGVIRELTGHGIGHQLHEDPDVPNYGRFGHGPRIVKGMAFCIEPMISMGRREIAVLSDEWTVITRDRQYAAHYENTIIITENGPEIITLTEGKNV